MVDKPGYMIEPACEEYYRYLGGVNRNQHTPIPLTRKIADKGDKKTEREKKRKRKQTTKKKIWGGGGAAGGRRAP
jgi:hypothetical protein